MSSPAPVQKRNPLFTQPTGWVLVLVFVCLILVIHNYGIKLWPDERIPMVREKVRPHPESSIAFTYNYSASFADAGSSQLSRVRVTEDGRELAPRTRTVAEVLQVGGARWSHVPGQILFSASDNTDPRSNGRAYVIHSPLLYHPLWGRLALAVFLLGVGWLYRSDGYRMPFSGQSGAPPVRGRLRVVVAAAAVFFVGMYCNTGTLAPYANTYPPHVDPETGYLFNTDHPHFRVMYEFISGAERSVWDGALMLRRILFPLIAWPFMRMWGFELGGTVVGLFINLAAFFVFVAWVRREIGERGAVAAAGLLALYPGVTYWAGLPYLHTLIVPLSLLLLMAMRQLARTSGIRFAAVSLMMGVGYLGYDLMPIFLPASVLLLVARRRWWAAAGSVGLQVLPLAFWLVVLSTVFGQSLQNSNTSVYGIIVSTYLNISDVGLWWAQVNDFPDVGAAVFFRAHFIFLPALVLAVVVLNAVTARVGLEPEEWALLSVVGALFLFNNLVPPYAGWSMRGAWISRIYQPSVPVLLLFVARWWQHCPPLVRPWRIGVRCLFAATMLGNALVVFGPILNNPGGVSERAFYGFYNHTDVHFLYEHYLKTHGRRPLGFPEPPPS